MDVDQLLEPISPDTPCGEDTPLFALEDLIKDTGGGAVAGAVRESVEPNWSEVFDSAQEHFAKCKHLRIALFLTLGALKREGLPGFRDGIVLMRGLMKQYWNEMFPPLDPDESMGDPDGWMERENILNDLHAPIGTSGDNLKFLARLSEVPLCSSRAMGRFGLKDIDAAKAKSGGDDDDNGDGGGDGGPNLSVIKAAFEDSDEDFLRENLRAIEESIENLEGIASDLSGILQSARPPSFDNLESLLKKLLKPVQEELTRRAPVPESFGDTGDFGGETGGEEGGGRGRGGPPGIHSREDVLEALRLICQYYAEHEPSSPVPLLILRAKRLVSKNFIDIINDLSPDAISQVEMISGGVSVDDF